MLVVWADVGKFKIEDLPVDDPRTLYNYDRDQADKMLKWAENEGTIQHRNVRWKIEEGGGRYRVRGEPR